MRKGFILCLLSLLLFGCAVQQDGLAARQEGAVETLSAYYDSNFSSESSRACYEDLTGDGVTELVVVEMLDENMAPVPWEGVSVDNFRMGELAVYHVAQDETVTCLLGETVAINHVGWRAVYLYTQAQSTYLLEYAPSESQGWYACHYSIYDFGQDGRQVLHSEAIQFPMDALEENRADFMAFRERVAGYTAQSEPLLVYYESGMDGVVFERMEKR